MKPICIIPARGGSKRIPNKNIKNFCGKPIIAYSIEAAKASKLFSDIIVSTDSLEIAEVAKSFGATVPFMRPNDIADDYTGTADVIVHAIRCMQNTGLDFDYVCCLYATAPLVKVDNIIKGYQLVTMEDVATVFTVVEFGFPIERALVINETQRIAMVWPEHMNTRSQDVSPKYHDAGQFYWLNVVRFLNDSRLYGADSLPVVIPRCREIDIDTYDDWEKAEIAYQIIRGQSNIDNVRRINDF